MFYHEIFLNFFLIYTFHFITIALCGVQVMEHRHVDY